MCCTSFPIPGHCLVLAAAGTTFSDTIKTNVAKSFFESDEEVVTNFYLKFCAATEASEFFIARTAVSEGMHHISPHLITVQDGIREQVLAWIPGTPEILYLRVSLYSVACSTVKSGA